ncbi:MAG: toprim domain-containing protein, partial [Candidatus Thorarchaeota archaeon]
VTEDQIRLLRRITNRIKIAFDGDEAGQKAMIKLVPMLLCFGFETKSIIFPKEHDPDSFLQTKLELDILPILSDIEVLSKYVSKDDFIGIIQKYNMEMIDDKYFSIYGIQKSNVVKKINSSIRSNKLINSDARFHLALLVDAFPNLINKLNESQKESILISKEDSNISKIVFEKNPYSEIKQPEKALEQILNRL